MDSKLTEVEVKRGYWFYAGEMRKTVMIFRLNYDFYYELEKDDFFNESDGTPELNEDGHTYLIKWPSKGFVFPPGSFSVPTNGKALSLKGRFNMLNGQYNRPLIGYHKQHKVCQPPSPFTSAATPSRSILPLRSSGIFARILS